MFKEATGVSAGRLQQEDIDPSWMPIRCGGGMTAAAVEAAHIQVNVSFVALFSQ